MPRTQEDQHGPAEAPGSQFHSPNSANHERQLGCNCTHCGGLLAFAAPTFGQPLRCHHCGSWTIAGKSYLLHTTRIDTGTPLQQPDGLLIHRVPRGDPPDLLRAKKLVQALALLILGFNLAFFLIAIVPGGVETVGALLERTRW